MKRNCVITFFIIFSYLLANAQELNIATYNIRVDKEEDVIKGNGWTKRCPKVCDIVKFHNFHIFGAQEVEQHQLNDMLGFLKEYKYIGIAREDGNKEGEFVPIFYRPDILQLVDSGNFWLSETPDRPSKGWDAVCYRICTWGKFKTKDNATFYYFNTHLDHRGVIARRQSANLIVSKIREIAGDTPVILTGDFNSGDDTEVYRIFKDSGIITDSYDMASFRLAWMGTANNFDPNIVTENRLDYIFVSHSFVVQQYGVLTDTYREIITTREITLPNFPETIVFRDCVIRIPSDHYPVEVIIKFPIGH